MLNSYVSSVSYYYPQTDSAGNAAYDIWFDRTSRRPQGRDDGAEIMIWLGSSDIGAPAYARAVQIGGIWWGYITWGAFHSGRGWNYIRYWRLSGGPTAVTLNLVLFFNDAERAGRLSSHWYLTGTEFGGCSATSKTNHSERKRPTPHEKRVRCARHHLPFGMMLLNPVLRIRA